ncbi:metallophosphoesterase family protein [Methylobacterium nodulans]|uniref:Bis(5'nucleosyl)-tetraphosphatase, ApaH n=1 Tax=Methylobacterium nodulans (strain LMG 21967 / CNCM I-2342 / ORS 2060) TaxID=460265 RepID=B8ISQ9_METNO|nr:metallophosphoesterase family protein [Methylobacterium nodulans]ACL60708.1 bis(5'nucleosyl)-tetraphosphatase, ApaH [Methylobacterium nodulans ORS 2060]
MGTRVRRGVRQGGAALRQRLIARFGRRQPPAPGPIEYWPALGGRSVVAFGDIHGRDDLLARAHARLDALSAARGLCPLEIYLGDLIDRGPDSRDVVERLIARAREREVIALRGNHEAMLLRALDDDEALRLWLAQGGEATLRAYRGAPPEGQGGAASAREILRRALPPAHLAFLRGMPVSYTIGALLFVHAGIRPGRLIDQQDEEDLLWIREPFLSSERDHGLLVVHGHSPVAEPDFRFNRINIDTGAVYTGRLTALLISDRAIEIV